jgi:hypothetical protein
MTRPYNADAHSHVRPDMTNARRNHCSGISAFEFLGYSGMLEPMDLTCYHCGLCMATSIEVRLDASIIPAVVPLDISPASETIGK